MIGGHPLMATGVGERAEAAEGLYLGGQDTAAERWGRDDRHGE
jgi:hypothetical protein